jgi:Kdo2-lipid IVA lauroyltransferase/acyltransferase
MIYVNKFHFKKALTFFWALTTSHSFYVCIVADKTSAGIAQWSSDRLVYTDSIKIVRKAKFKPRQNQGLTDLLHKRVCNTNFRVFSPYLCTMYYIVFGFLYVVSLLPFFILYRLSDGIAFLLYHVFRYRKAVVLYNLGIAFPEKTVAERTKIAKQFYRYFTDTFIETLKFISISRSALERRSTGSFDLINELIASGKNVHLMAGHQFNWEYANLLYAMNLKIPFVGVYIPIKNSIFSRIFFNFRQRYGTILISAPDFKNKMHEVFKTQYMLALAADQNPGNPAAGYWLRFFGRPTPFVTGPEKGAIKNDAAVVYIGFHKVKRGYYRFDTHLLSTQSNQTGPGELTRKYRDILETTIRQDPANYLWSHRRFKFDWKPEYGEILD